MNEINQKGMTEQKAAEYLGLSVHTLRQRRFKRQQPAYLKIGKSVRYLPEDLESFLQAHRINPAA